MAVQLADVNQQVESVGGPCLAEDDSLYMVELGVGFLFTAKGALGGCELYRGNGVPGAEVLVRDIHPGGGDSSPYPLGVVGGVAYFIAGMPATGNELFRTDGTTAGTRMVAEIIPGPLGRRCGTSRRSGRSRFSPRTTSITAWSSGAPTAPLPARCS